MEAFAAGGIKKSPTFSSKNQGLNLSIDRSEPRPRRSIGHSYRVAGFLAWSIEPTRHAFPSDGQWSAKRVIVTFVAPHSSGAATASDRFPYYPLRAPVGYYLQEHYLKYKEGFHQKQAFIFYFEFVYLF